MATETVKIDSVDGPNASGWYEVVLGDGRKVSTKDEDVATAAFQARGTDAEAKIGEKKKGNFTNLYLNEINGVGGKPAAGARKASTSAASNGSGGKDNERIARQWAYGRAVELLIAAGGPTVFPLPPEEMSNLSAQATALLDATRS